MQIKILIWSKTKGPKWNNQRPRNVNLTKQDLFKTCFKAGIDSFSRQQKIQVKSGEKENDLKKWTDSVSVSMDLFGPFIIYNV